MTAGTEVAVRADPPVSFERFYEAEYRAVLGLAWVLSGDLPRAEELTQDAFEVTFRRWEHVRDLDDAGAWVRRVVANKSASNVRRLVAERRALDRLRDRRRPTSSDAAPLPDEDLWIGIRQLPDRQRQAVALHYVEDLSVSEIARILELAENTVKVHLYRGRRALADRLADDQEVDR